MPRKTLADQIKEKYEPRALAVLNSIRQELTDAGYESDEPFDLSDDCARWVLVIKPGEGREEAIDITLEFTESEECDGTKGGITFRVDVVCEGGRMLGGLTPYNYTEAVWVKRNDPEAVEDRFAIIEAADPFEIIGLVEGYN